MSSLDRRGFLKTTAAAYGLTAFPSASTSSPSDEDPLGVRSDFPITREQIYFNSAAVAPVPRVVRDAAVEYADEKMLRPASGRRSERKDRARSRFAELFGTKPEEVALLYATSEGENIVAEGLDLKPGDNVVIDELHFTTSFVLYRRLEETKDIELRVVPEKEGRSRLEDFDAHIDAKTRLVSVAWVSNRNGYRHDLRALAEIAHARGALLYADGIQAAGTFPANLSELGVDFLCTGSYKWLLASFGVAPFFVREEHLDRIPPDDFGHGQVAEELPGYRFRLQDSAKKYEYAASAYSAVYQLDAALGYLKTVGLARIEEHTVGLARELREGVARLGFETLTPRENASPIVAFVHGHDPDKLARMFEEEGIVVTFRENKTQVRAGVALFNNQNDVKLLLKALEKVA